MPKIKSSKTSGKKSSSRKTRVRKTKTKTTPAVATPAVATPAVVTPAVVTPAVVKEIATPAVVEETTVAVETKAKEAKEVEQMVKSIAKVLVQDEDVKIDLEFNTTVNSIKTLVADTRGVLSSFKALHKRVNKRIRVLNRRPKGGKRRGGNQKTNPSGFNKPTKITNELAKFLKVDNGTYLPRTDVTRRINAFIKEHSLQGMMRPGKDGIEKIDNRFINTALPKSDKRNKHATLLRKLLNPKVPLSYFNLQTYLSPHFIKEVKIVEVKA